ncbi:GroES-like protein [Saitoella complicata NRRL Y-17804]|uniref:GroES-like protein n=1 Tax=Saitoella complicata (strain BCRC 22490 / CBS 7301 / JCM 7358 / NBRC 10748 / NRRL Y-17804) TaxID=698492 RepID=UPI000867FA8A|nr:GroES-like protein [Saitoella complicata NRRL Y-17804]ODQ54598.1 GroES-like protein [Saitoella complicata NRRL Y-17804]
MQALIATEDHSAAVQSAPIPPPSSAQILVRVHAVAQNPTDWKHVAALSEPGNYVGCDFAGVVEAVGDSVKTRQVGDRVAGFVHGGIGSFAEYLITEPAVTFAIPSSTSFKAAATYGIACTTAYQALHQRLGISIPGSLEKAVLVWGGATSVGCFAIQLAKLAGATVIATASPDQWEYLKGLGADVCVDYKDPEVVKKVKDAAGENGVTYGLDCISEEQTVKAATSCFTGSGKLITLLGTPRIANSNPDQVTVQPTLVYTILGRAFEMRDHEYPASPEDRRVAEQLYEELPEWIQSGKVKPNTTRIVEGGLDGILRGFEEMKSGKVRGEKLVYVIKE